jgi:GNAT superfamily N-acetyltransferase
VSVTADVRLRDFLVAYLGDWPDKDRLTVIGAPVRREPGWDGEVRQVVGVADGDGGVLSVPPDAEAMVRNAVHSWADVRTHLPKAMGRPKARVYSGTFRWTTKPADLADAGEWVPFEDSRVPEWLKPFGGQALIAFDDDGEYAAGVGIKRHNAAGLEISVGTESAHRGKGLAARLVAQAARWILAEGAVPIYLHDPANVGSDRTALRAGFPDEGWKIVGMVG